MRSLVHRRAGALLLTAAVTTGVAGCGLVDPSGQPDSSSSSSVALEPKGAPSRTTVGVVVSLTSEPGQGGDWSSVAEGAEVAAHRYGLGDVRVRVLPENDKGSAEGARDAVRRLVDKHVSGIVMATAGDHVRSGLAEARRAGVPVLLPYDASGSGLTGAEWSTGPDRGQVAATLTGALRAEGLRRPLLVDAGGGDLRGLAPVRWVRYRPGDDPAALADSVLRRARTARADAILISGPAALQGQVVAALQGRDTPQRIFLTPQALSPAFTAALDGAGGSLDADLTTVGTRGRDTTTLQPGEAGHAASGFFTALRSAAADPGIEDFFDGRAFAQVAPAADSRSHDAVVALVTAAARAGSAQPGDVRTTLAHLVVTSADGLAGPDLDFLRRSAVRSGEVTALHATTQDPGVLPAGGPAQIHWFASSS